MVTVWHFHSLLTHIYTPLAHYDPTARVFIPRAYAYIYVIYFLKKRFNLSQNELKSLSIKEVWCEHLKFQTFT